MKYARLLSIFVAVLVLVLGSFSPGTAQGPIKLGAIMPLGDITGDQGAKAMKVAVKEINNAGGLLGRQVELIVVDDEMKAEKGAAAVEKLVTVDKVDILVGGMASGVHLGQIPIMKKYEKVTVWIGAASSRAEQAMGPVDWYFHLHPWDYQQGASYIEGWSAMEKKRPEVKIAKWFNANEEGAFGTASFKAAQAQYKDWKNARGEQVTIEGEPFKSAALGGGDYRTVLRHAKEAKPDIFLWTGYDADALPIMEQAKEVGFAPPIFIGSPPGWPIGIRKIAPGGRSDPLRDVGPLHQGGQPGEQAFLGGLHQGVQSGARHLLRPPRLHEHLFCRRGHQEGQDPGEGRPDQGFEGDQVCFAGGRDAHHQTKQRDQEPGVHQAEDPPVAERGSTGHLAL